MNDLPKIKAFISYAHNDKYYADVLIKILKQHVAISKEFIWDIWCDKRIEVGEKWHEVISKEVTESDCAILLLSPSFFGSEYIERNELNEFLKKTENANKPFLFFPFFLSYIDITGYPKLAERQLFMPRAEDYNEIPSKFFSFDVLVKRDPRHGQPQESPWINRYCADLAKSLEATAGKVFHENITGDLAQKVNKTLRTIKTKSQAPKLNERSHLPERDPNFIGREKDVKKLFSRLKEKGVVSVTGINGMGGVGKTSIVVEVCHKIKKSWNTESALFKNGILWLRLEKQHTQSTIAEIIRGQIGLNTQISSINENYNDIVNYLKLYDILIVIDSAEQNEEILFSLIRFLHGFSMLVTSRKNIPSITNNIDVDVMDKKDALELFTKYVNKNTGEERNRIQELCKEVGYLPLAIKILASLVATNRKTKTIHQIHQDFKRKKISMLEMATNSQTEEDKKNVNVAYCFSLSYDNLNEQDKDIFMRMSTFEHPFPVERMNDLIEKKNISTTMLDKLVELSLTEKDLGKNKYYLHPLLKEFAVTKAIDSGIISEIYEKKKVSYLKLIEERNYDDLDEIEAIVHDASQKGDTEYLFKCIYQLDEFLDNKGLWERKVSLNTVVIASVKNKLKKDPSKGAKKRLQRELAKCLSSMATTLAGQGKYGSAIEKYKNALELSKQNELFVKYAILDCEFRRGNCGRSYIENLKNIRESSMVGDHTSLGRFNKTMGHIYHEYGYFSLALQCAKANLSHKEWEEEYQRKNLVIALDDLIDIYYSRGQYTKALPFYKKLLELSYKNDWIELAYIFLVKITGTYLELGELDLAEQYFNDYEEINLTMGDSTDDIKVLSGHLKLVQKKYNEASNIFTQLRKKETENYWLAKTFIELNELNKAKECINFLVTFHQNGKNSIELAKAFSLMAKLLLHEGEIHQASKYLSEVIKTKEEHGIIDMSEEIETEGSLIKVMENKGIEEAFYFSVKNNCKPIEVEPDFIIGNIPHSIVVNNKEMVQIQEGICFIGEHEIKEFDLDTILEHIDELTNQIQLPSSQENKHFFILPDNPNVSCDNEFFLDLVENSMSLDKTQKQQVIDAFPNLKQEEIDELIRVFLKEKDKFSELAIEYEADVEKLRKERYMQLAGIGLNNMAKQIYLYPYYIDKYPVTVREYKQYCDKTSYPYPGYWDKELMSNYPDSPVVNVSFEEAHKYAQWMGMELPTADEWEKACRGTQGNLYPWGNSWDESKTKCHFSHDVSIMKKDRDTENKGEIEGEKKKVFNKLKNEEAEFEFKIPYHPNTTFDDEYFAYLLEHSISLSQEEKEKIINSIQGLDQNQVDSLIAIFEDERKKFSELIKEDEKPKEEDTWDGHNDQNLEEIKILFRKFLTLTNNHSSDFGIYNLGGNIQEWTCTSKEKDKCIVKGGSWLSSNPSEDCKGFKSKSINEVTKRYDLGFRCAKPIFKKGDVEP